MIYLNFKIQIVNQKLYKNLLENYKTDKFLKLYFKIYSYVLSISKEKIINKKALKTKNELLRLFLEYLHKFLEVKDFYHWKDRLYFLLTEKHFTGEYKRFELLYNSKAKEKYQEYTNSRISNINNEEKKYKFINSISNHYNCIYSSKEYEVFLYRLTKRLKTLPSENMLKLYYKMYLYILENIFDEIDKVKFIKFINYIKYFLEAKDFYHWKDRITKLFTEYQGATSYKKYELLYGSKAKKYFDRYITKNKQCRENSLKIKYGPDVKNVFQLQSVQDKSKNTLYKKYNVTSSLELVTDNHKSHSKIADDFCKSLDTLYNTLDTEDTKYYIKNEEFYIKDYHNFYYDFTNIIEKWIVEFQGTYTHGLLEGQEYSYGRPVEEVWKYDKEKRILAEQNGYKVFYVYEDEYRNNKSKCLENLLKEIKEYVYSKENMIQE